MTVLLVDVATTGPVELTAADAAAEWARSTGVAVDQVTVSDGSVGFTAALVPVTGPGSLPATREDHSGTLYAAAAEVDDACALADILTGEVSRAVIATAVRPAAMPDGGGALLVELAVRGGLDRARARSAAAGESGVEGAAELLGAARAAVGGTDLVGAVETDAPLLGLNGVAASGQWPGGPAQAQEVEARLGEFADLLYRAAMQAGPTRLMPAPRAASMPGAGSGGGLGHAVVLLGGRLRPAVEIVAEVLGLSDRVAAADLIVAVTPELGAHEMDSGLVPVLGPLATQAVVPLIVVTQHCLAGRREWSAAGVSAVYEASAATLARVAHTWSPVSPFGSDRAAGGRP
jgi:glycerate kinase